MSHCLDNRSALVFLVEPDAGRRGMLSDGIKKMGFTKFQAFGTLVDALAVIRAERVAPDWLITTLDAENSVNALSILAMTTQEPRLRNMRMSLVVEQSEQYVLPNAFEMGLFSFHMRDAVVGKQLNDFKELLNNGEVWQWNDCLIASHYLRWHLEQSEFQDDLVNLEMTLLSLFPSQAKLVVYLAQALHLQGRSRAALQTLKRAHDLNIEFKSEADQLRAVIMQSIEGMQEDASFAETYDISLAAVIDPDEAARNTVTEALADLGVADIQTFSDGDTAWNFLKETEAPDLIIMEWRVPEVPSHVLVQRIRGAGQHTVPIIIFSSLVKKDSDRVLLREMGITDVIEKPLYLKQLIEEVRDVVAEEKRPTSSKTLERKIRSLLRSKQIAKARALYDKSEETKGFPDYVRKAIEADFAFHRNDLDTANRLAVDALHVGGEDLMLLNLLGKIYMKMKMPVQSMTFFERANKLSPDNIERLCNMAEAQAQAGVEEDAESTLEAAKKIDDDNAQVAESEVKVALASGNEEKSRRLMENLEHVEKIVGFMNNRAVSLAAQNKYREAVNLYKNAIKTLPKRHAALRSTIIYNLGLCYIKAGKTTQGEKVLKEVLRYKNSPVLAKAKSLQKRAAAAITTGVKLELRTDNGDMPQEEYVAIGAASVPTAIEVERGSMRCHLVYQCSGGLYEEVATLMKRIPSLSTKDKPARRTRGKKAS